MFTLNTSISQISRRVVGGFTSSDALQRRITSDTHIIHKILEQPLAARDSINAETYETDRNDLTPLYNFLQDINRLDKTTSPHTLEGKHLEDGIFYHSLGWTALINLDPAEKTRQLRLSKILHDVWDKDAGIPPPREDAFNAVLEFNDCLYINSDLVGFELLSLNDVTIVDNLFQVLYV